MARHVKTDSASAPSPIRYMDGSSLQRPFDLPHRNNYVLIGLIAAAAFFGILIGLHLYDVLINSQVRQEATVEQTINRGVTLDLPVLDTYVSSANSDISAALTAAGYAIIDMNTIPGVSNAGASGSLDLVKLPSDVTVADAAITYAKGISSLSGEDAARYLSGSWRLTVDRPSSVDMKVKYADFTSKAATTAIQSAITTEGWDKGTLGDSGIDASGNTYQNGTITIDGAIYNWSVSVCPLSAVYSNSGLPSDALYVGIRLAG